MASPALALTADKKRTTVTLPAPLLTQAEEMAEQRNTSVSAIITQAIEAGMASLQRQDRAQQTYEHLRSALAGLSEDEQLLVDGVRLSASGSE